MLAPLSHVHPRPCTLTTTAANAPKRTLLGTNESSLPHILLNSGGTAVYNGGNGTSVLRFLYTVEEGDSSTDLDVAVVASDVTETIAVVIPTEGASAIIYDIALESPAVVTLPKPGAEGSLGADANIVIDTT